MTLRGIPPRDQRQDGPPLLSLRTAVIILGALVTALLAGVLTFAVHDQPAAAVLAGGGGFAAMVMFLDRVVA